MRQALQPAATRAVGKCAARVLAIVLCPLLAVLASGCATGTHLDPELAGGSTPLRLELTLQEPAPTVTRGPFDETFGARLGGMLVGSFQTEASLDLVGTSAGSTVDFEDDLGLDGHGGAIRADAWFRFGRRHRLDLAWFAFDRSSTRAINRDIIWGDTTFPINTALTGELETDILQLRYTWNFLAGDDYELGAGIGIYGMNLRAALIAPNVGVERTFQTPVPLPVLSLQGGWQLANRLQLVGAAQFFFLELEDLGNTDEVSGSVVDLMLGLEYELFEHVGVGAAYNWFQVNTGLVRNRLDFDIEYGYSALFLYMTVKI